jgi:hypothetical protein
MNVGYKEWSLICAALGSGRQSLLLRKGGIAEGRAGFAFQHRRFFLLPTLFHQQESQVRELPRVNQIRDEQGSWVVEYEAEVVGTWILRDWSIVQSLQPFHIWKEEVVRRRFEDQAERLIHAALVRVRRLARPHVWPESKELKGCRSWVTQAEACHDDDEALASPVLSEETFSELRSELEQIVSTVRTN